MREDAASSLIFKQAVVLLTCLMAYTTLIYQLGRESAQVVYNLPYNTAQHKTMSKDVTEAYSVLKRKAYIVDLDLWRYADTLRNQAERRILALSAPTIMWAKLIASLLLL